MPAHYKIGLWVCIITEGYRYLVEWSCNTWKLVLNAIYDYIIGVKTLTSRWTTSLTLKFSSLALLDLISEHIFALVRY